MTEVTGKLLQEFYLALNDGAKDRAIETLDQLECITADIEGDEVVREITQDCRKKVGQLLRAAHVSGVQQLLTFSRKRLHTKASLEPGNNQQHAQRHLNTLIELLGEWSNIVNDLSGLNISSETLTLTIDPLHARVAEMSIDCFKQFNEDKNLANWQARIRRCVSENQVLNISALDQIIGQLAGMRAVVAQYQLFLSTRCDFQSLVNHDMVEWREVDGSYIALEYGYMLGAMREATNVNSLLELQDGRIYALQSVEDCFFVVQRSLERAISTAQKGNIYAICARLVELIDPNQLDGDERNVFQILTSKDSFKRKRFEGKALVEEQQTRLPPPPAPSSRSGTSSSANGNTSSPNPPTSATVKESVSSAMEDVFEGNLASGVTTLSSTFAGLAGGFLEVVAPTNQPSPEEEETTLDTQIATAASNTLETFIGALTDDIDNADDGDDSGLRAMLDLATGIPPTKSTSMNATKYPRTILCTEDASLQLNSLAIPINALELVSSLIGEENLGAVATLDLAREEVNRAKEAYRKLLAKETQAIVAAEFYGGLYAQYAALGPVPGTGVNIRIAIEGLDNYELTGAEMDRRATHSHLVSAVSMCINASGDKESTGDSTDSPDVRSQGWIATAFGPQLSTRAYAEMLKQLSVILSESIIERMLLVKFNEWGSMLIHQEIHDCVSILEAAAVAVDESVRDYMEGAVWAATIVSLDQPSDIRRYKIPSDVFTADTVRALMRQRVEFSQEAIRGVKI